MNRKPTILGVPLGNDTNYYTDRERYTLSVCWFCLQAT